MNQSILSPFGQSEERAIAAISARLNREMVF